MALQLIKIVIGNSNLYSKWVTVLNNSISMKRVPETFYIKENFTNVLDMLTATHDGCLFFISVYMYLRHVMDTMKRSHQHYQSAYTKWGKKGDPNNAEFDSDNGTWVSGPEGVEIPMFDSDDDDVYE